MKVREGIQTEALVSILVPLYNKENYVAETVSSALAQTHPNIEVIVLDDGSTDESLRKVRMLTDPRLKVVSRENKGANVTRNELLGMANGDFIQFLDADDLLHPDKIARQVSLLVPGIDVVFVGVRDDSGQDFALPDPDCLHASLVRVGMITVSPLYRRASLLAVGGWSEGLLAAQEFDLHVRLLAGGHWRRAAVVPDVLATYRRVPGSTSSNELRVYRGVATALSPYLRHDLPPEELESYSFALSTSARHLARHRRLREAASILKAVKDVNGGMTLAFPRRTRWIGSPGILVAAELVDYAIVRKIVGRIRDLRILPRSISTGRKPISRSSVS